MADSSLEQAGATPLAGVSRALPADHPGAARLTRTPPPPASRLAMALGFAAGFIAMAHRSGFGVLYPAMVADQGWSVGEVTAAFSVAMLLYSPTAVLTGQLVDRLGVRATMLLGALVVTAGLGAVSLVSELWQLYVLYALGIGIGSSAIGFIPMMKLVSLRASARLGLAIGLFNVGQGIGALVASPVLQLIIDWSGWRAGFAALGLAVTLVLGPLILLGAPDRAANRVAHPSDREGGLGWVWREPTFWLIMAANAAVGYTLLLPAHHVAHLVLVGLPHLLAATAGGLMGACIGLGALLGGWWVDRWGGGRLGLGGLVLFCLGVTALILTSEAHPWLAGVYVLAAGLGRGVVGVTVSAFQGRAFAGPTLGRVTGLLDLGFGLGAFAGPYLTALSRDLTDSYVPGLASAILAVALAHYAVVFSSRSPIPARPRRARG